MIIGGNWPLPVGEAVTLKCLTDIEREWHDDVRVFVQRKASADEWIAYVRSCGREPAEIDNTEQAFFYEISMD